MIKYSTQNLSFFFLLSILLLQFSACKKTKLEPESTDLVVKVKDDLGNDIAGSSTQIYLFDDSTMFRAAWQNDDFTGAINNQLLVGSQATFTELTSEKNYWILVQYTKTVDGVSVKLNNFFTQNTLKNLLEPGAITTIIITLSPYETGHVAFYSPVGDLNDDDLAIEVFFDGRSVGSITGLSETVPTSVNDPNVVKVLYQSGAVAYSYYAVGNNGCVWQGTVTVNTGTNEITAVPITRCGFGHVNFWMNNTTFAALGAVTITLNDDDNLGVLNTSRNTAPGNCDTQGVLRVSRPVGGVNGKYVVKAVSDNSCVWVKTIEINEGCQNTPVEITPCD